MESKSFCKVSADPTVAQLFVDPVGKIQEISDNAAQILRISSKEMVGKHLDGVFSALPSLSDNFLSMRFIMKNPLCPQDLFVKMKRDTQDSAIAIFRFSYSHWSACNSGQHLCVFLCLQTVQNPIVQQFLSLYKTDDRPLVLLNADRTIISYNAHFLSILNFIDEDKVLNRRLQELLDEKYGDPFPFNFEKKTAYIKNISRRSRGPWKTLFSFPAFVNAGRAISSFFIKSSNTEIRAKQRFIMNTLDNQTSLPFIAFAKAINFSNQDLEIQMHFALAKGCEMAIALGHPVSGKHSLTYNPAYSVDLKYSDQLYCQIFRKAAPMHSGTYQPLKKNLSICLLLKKIGPYLTISANDAVLAEYADPNPVVDMYASFLYFYLWKQPISMSTFSIKIRPTLFNIDKMEREEAHVLAFKSNPHRFFRYYAEPVNALNRPALAVRFFQIPIHHEKKERDAALLLFEEARAHIKENFCRKIDLHSIAHRCCVSYVHFLRRFKELFGTSPKALQIAYRLEEAKNLLRSGKFKIREIGEMLGFDDEAHFQHLFKKYFQTSPGKFILKS